MIFSNYFICVEFLGTSLIRLFVLSVCLHYISEREMVYNLIKLKKKVCAKVIFNRNIVG